MDFIELGQAVKNLRKERGVTQHLVAQHLGMSRATLSAFENGRAGDIGLRKAIQIFDYLGRELRLREKSPFPTFEELRDAKQRS